MRVKSPGLVAKLGALFNRRYYVQSLLFYGRTQMFYTSIVAAMLAAVMLFVSAKSGMQYRDELPLAHGTHAIGKVVAVTIKSDYSRTRGAFATSVDYAFSAVGPSSAGQEFIGSTHRILRRKPVFAVGDRIDVIYDAADPTRSSISIEFDGDLKGKLFISCLTLLLSFYFLLPIARYWQWGAQATDAGDDAAPTGTRGSV